MLREYENITDPFMLQVRSLNEDWDVGLTWCYIAVINVDGR